VKEALEFLVADEEKRRSNRKKMSLEADGLEIVEDDEELIDEEDDDSENDEIVVGGSIEVGQGEFVVPRDEENTE
jgi:uncharacterized DUF497 family protein